MLKAAPTILGLHLPLLMLLTGCDPCSQEVWSNTTSPDGEWTATTVMRDCGATTSVVVSVNVHLASSRGLREDDNALVLKHGQSPTVTCIDKDTLVLDRTYGSKDVIARRSQIGPIKVQYKVQ